MPNAFFLEPDNLNGNSFSLDESESHHASHVFRLQPGDPIALLNGEGLGFQGVIENNSNGIVSGIIQKKLKSLGENDSKIIIAPSILKRDRFESLIEKATELGVRQINPILTDRCVKRTLNLERCKKIVMSAAKQCQRSYFPMVCQPTKLLAWLDKPGHRQCFAGMMGTSKQLSDYQFDNKIPVSVLIGPEGDFSDNEIVQMNKKRVKFFSLGSRRLRADTAAQASLSILNELLT